MKKLTLIVVAIATTITLAGGSASATNDKGYTPPTYPPAHTPEKCMEYRFEKATSTWDKKTGWSSFTDWPGVGPLAWGVVPNPRTGSHGGTVGKDGYRVYAYVVVDKRAVTTGDCAPPPPTTTTPPTTIPPTTTTPPTTVPPTTEPPATTEPPQTTVPPDTTTPETTIPPTVPPETTTPPDTTAPPTVATTTPPTVPPSVSPSTIVATTTPPAPVVTTPPALPKTGSEDRWLIAIGLAAIASGYGAVVAARRR